MRWEAWAAFAVLCAWAASAWLLAPGNDPLPGLERQGLGFTGIAVMAACLVKGQQAAWRLRGMAALASVLFFAAPAVLMERAKEYAPETSVAVVFALAPVVVVLAWAAASGEEGGMRQLVPALAGFGGVLFLLPFELPVSGRGWESLAEMLGAMVLVACAGVWLHGLLRGMGRAEALVVVAATNAVALLGWCAVQGRLDLRWSDVTRGVSISSFVGVVVVLLTVYLLREVNPVRFSARLLVIPLVTILEGLVLLRPEVTGRMVVGILLLAAGAVWMLVTRELAEEEVLTLR